MITVPLGPRRQRYLTAAAPSYLERHGTPRHPKELLEHACIRQRFASGRMPQRELTRGKQVVTVAPKGQVVADRMAPQLAAARAGLGIIHTFGGFLSPALEAGALVAILSDWKDEFAGPFLYCASRRHMPAPLRAFVDHVKGASRAAPAAQGG